MLKRDRGGGPACDGRGGYIRDPSNYRWIGEFGSIQVCGAVVGWQVSTVNSRDAGEIERAIRPTRLRMGPDLKRASWQRSPTI